MSNEGDAAPPGPWVAPGSPPPSPSGPPSPPSAGVPAAAGYHGPAPGSAPPTGWNPPAPGHPAPPPGQPTAPSGYPAPPPRAPGGYEFRPGIVPLRPLALGDIWGGVIKAIRGNVAATMGLSLLVSAVCIVPATALGAWVASFETVDFASSTFEDDAGFGLYGLIGQYIPALASGVSTIALTAFLAYVVGQAVLGRKVGAGETWDGTWRRLLAIAGTVVLSILVYAVVLGLLIGLPLAVLVAAGDPGPATILLVVLGVLAALVAMLWLWTRLAFVTAVVVLENRSPFGAFARSWRLTSGSQFWRIFGIRLLTVILVSIAAQVVALPIGLIGVFGVMGAGGEEYLFVAQAVITGVTSLISGAITTPFTAGVDALMAVDQRIRREGLDVQLVHAAQRGAPAPWPSAARPA
ncbi:MAG: hypothetical protein ACRCZP_03855 [Phycicoccus sp.]